MPSLPNIEGLESEPTTTDTNSILTVATFITYVPGANGGTRRKFNWTVPLTEEGLEILEKRLQRCRDGISETVGYKIKVWNNTTVTNAFVDYGRVIPNPENRRFPVVTPRILRELTEQGDLFAAKFFVCFEIGKEIYYLRKVLDAKKRKHYDMWKRLKESFRGHNPTAFSTMEAIEQEYLGNQELLEMCCRLGSEGG